MYMSMISAFRTLRPWCAADEQWRHSHSQAYRYNTRWGIQKDIIHDIIVKHKMNRSVDGISHPAFASRVILIGTDVMAGLGACELVRLVFTRFMKEVWPEVDVFLCVLLRY